MPRSNADDETEAETRCDYCQAAIEDDNYLDCQKCEQSVHIKCLPHASTPGDLLGDVFFDFTCIKCVRLEPTGAGEDVPKERFVRQRIPWLLVLTLTLYNLSIKSKGLSHHGYFHWRTHIISFVDKNWNYIFEPRVRRRKQWAGSVSGALSHNSPEYFQSGVSVCLEHGWWRLAKPNLTPRSVRAEYEQRLLERQQLRTDRRAPALDENSCGSDLSVTDHLSDAQASVTTEETAEGLSPPSEGCARAIPYMGRLPKLQMEAQLQPEEQLQQQQEQLHQSEETLEEAAQQQPLSSVQASLMDFLAESLGGDDLSMFMPPPLIGAGDKGDFFMSDALLEAPGNSASLFELENNFGLPPVEEPEPLPKLEQPRLSSSSSSESEEEPMETEQPAEEESNSYQPRIVQVTNFQAQEQQQQPPQIKEEPPEVKEETEDAEIEPPAASSNREISLEPCKPSGFVRQPRRNWPWLQETEQEEPESQQDEAPQQRQLRLMNVQEEEQLQQQLHKIFALEPHKQGDVPAYVRRLYRKLCVRQWKREHNRPIFNLDEHIDPTARARRQLAKQQQAQILDRYQLLEQGNPSNRSSFYARIVGHTEYELFESPYTQRVLHPFIYRNQSMGPPWLRLMCELQYRVNRCYPNRSTIDFCYVRPQHIPAVNALLQSVFWPGIDVSDCLSYPDYSVVALYKKLVIGCGFLVPDVGYNEAYISFMAVRHNWQRAGIASFMLYHLIQTCMSKDITLHVSASNSAVMLYQKFGFKIEEVILDFYDKYLPPDSKQSRNAFFLRLMR
ncbi:cysteine-rich protein 2-binding protein [Drosophila novamexicana]|uniref:cysteine-rich protein 2-binding protein n=1 Tax=Drosophila novamexicana TaxID=47314 RepID=UPI0011E59C1A|nr:cysteine-rich protein 2-binding protein [Drosophila novamexicana]